MTWTNQLYYGDNLRVLREEMADESVDLVYLDPPFNSAANYNVLFREASGEQSAAQIMAFEDTWHWTQESEAAYQGLVADAPGRLARLVEAMRQMLGTSDMMAYLVMMAPRLVGLHRVLKPTGSVYLHCDQVASHYLKLLLDAVFSPDNFRNEIIWKRKAGRGETNVAAIRFGVTTDSILFYARSRATPLNRQHRENKQEYIESKFNQVDSAGRRYHLDNLSSPSYRPRPREGRHRRLHHAPNAHPRHAHGGRQRGLLPVPMGQLPPPPNPHRRRPPRRHRRRPLPTHERRHLQTRRPPAPHTGRTGRALLGQ